jgi:hypothetical protein
MLFNALRGLRLGGVRQVIARCLGHATTKMSEQRYARPGDASLKAVVAALDREFKSSSKPVLKATQDDPG